MIEDLKNDIEKLKNPQKAKILQGFFKTGKGQYGEGDIFYGIMVPETRKLVGKYYNDITFSEIQTLLKSPIHEARLVGNFCLVKKFDKGNYIERGEIYDFYLENLYGINNWDLVDLSAPNIVGLYLCDDRTDDKYSEILYTLVKSDNLWKRRISILATFSFIRNKNYAHALRICELLIDDKHDLIHKACGWMLREIGKRDEEVLRKFLDKNISNMPRTMLRYSIEKFSKEERKIFLTR